MKPESQSPIIPVDTFLSNLAATVAQAGYGLTCDPFFDKTLLF